MATSHKSSKRTKSTISSCKGKIGKAHNPNWQANNTWSKDTWQLRCKSCGITLGLKRIIDGQPLIDVKKFPGHEDFLKGPK